MCRDVANISKCTTCWYSNVYVIERFILSLWMISGTCGMSAHGLSGDLFFFFFSIFFKLCTLRGTLEAH